MAIDPLLLGADSSGGRLGRSLVSCQVDVVRRVSYQFPPQLSLLLLTSLSGVLRFRIRYWRSGGCNTPLSLPWIDVGE